MERLSRFDIAAHGDVAMVVVESDLLPPDPAIVVIPLLSGYPAIRHLNPVILHEGREMVLATRLIAAVRRAGPAPRRKRGGAGRRDHPRGRCPDGGGVMGEAPGRAVSRRVPGRLMPTLRRLF